jgi:CBS domain-containing protein
MTDSAEPASKSSDALNTTMRRILLTEVARLPLVRNDDSIGRVDDMIVRIGGRRSKADDGISRYPLVVGLQARVGSIDAFVPISTIVTIDDERFVFNGTPEKLASLVRRPGEVLLRRDVLNHSLIDVASGRLVRATDIVIECIDGQWRVTGVDTKVHGFLHGSFFHRKTSEPTGQTRGVVDWLSVEPLVSHVPTAKLRLPLSRLRRLHPAQIADLVEDASHEEGEEIIAAVHADPELEADVFEEMDTEHQVEFLKDLPDDQAAKILAGMAPDDAADLISDINRGRRAALLARLPTAQQAKVKELLQYNPDSAGGLMTTDFFVASANSAAEQVLDGIKKARGDITTVYATDDLGHLVGCISTTTLLRADPTARLSNLMEQVPITVGADADMSDVAVLMADFNLTSLPVVDEEDKPLGVVAVDDVLETMVPWSWRKRMEGAG